MREFLCGRDDDSLDFRSKTAVGIRDGTLVLEIKHVPDAPYYMGDTQLAAGIDSKVVVFDYLDPVHTADSLAYDIHTLVHAEESAFVLVDTDCDDDFIEHSQRPAENIQMAGGKRIERSREKCFTFHNFQSIGVLPSFMRSSLVLEKCLHPKKAPPASGEGWAASST